MFLVGERDLLANCEHTYMSEELGSRAVEVVRRFEAALTLDST